MHCCVSPSSCSIRTVKHVPRVPVTPTGVALVGSVVLMGVRHAAAVVEAEDYLDYLDYLDCLGWAVAAAADVVVVLPRFATHMDAESVRIHTAQVLMGCVVLTGALDASQG